MIDFLKGWGSLIIAGIALIQPWLIATWKRFFRQGEIDIHETGGIELGYNNFGPTIGLNGTLRAANRDQFVRSISLTITKMKDNSRHTFEWGLFRSAKLSSSGTQEMSFELPSGFMLTTAQPHRYSIQFYDAMAYAEVRQHLDKLREA